MKRAADGNMTLWGCSPGAMTATVATIAPSGSRIQKARTVA